MPFLSPISTPNVHVYKDSKVEDGSDAEREDKHVFLERLLVTLNPRKKQYSLKIHLRIENLRAIYCAYSEKSSENLEL